MHRIARVAALGSTVLVVAACAKKEEPAKDTTAAMAPAAAPAAAAAPTLALSSVAGDWAMASTPMAGKDTSPTKYTMNAKADTVGWTMTMADKQVVPTKVSVAGDSIMLSSAEFNSQRRKGVRLTANTTLRLVDGKLTGVTTAHYNTKGADSTLQMKTEGTKAP